MKPVLPVLVWLCLLFAWPAHGQSGHWRDSHGKPIAETESMRSKDGFAGSILATTDADWRKKWDTPPETEPRFNRARSVGYGTKVFILTLFSNPRLDAAGMANIRCDLKISAPTGKVAIAEKDRICFTGPAKESPYNMRLSAPVMVFSGDPGDPSGTWVVDVVLRDTLRNTELALRTTFELTP